MYHVTSLFVLVYIQLYINYELYVAFQPILHTSVMGVTLITSVLHACFNSICVLSCHFSRHYVIPSATT